MVNLTQRMMTMAGTVLLGLLVAWAPAFGMRISLPKALPQEDGHKVTTTVLFPVQRNGRFGFLDIKGTLVVPPQFREVKPFTEGLAMVAKEKYGFIDSRGKVVIELKFDRATSFSDGLALVSVQGKWGFINPAGEMVIQPQFASVFNPDQYADIRQPEGRTRTWITPEMDPGGVPGGVVGGVLGSTGDNNLSKAVKIKEEIYQGLEGVEAFHEGLALVEKVEKRITTYQDREGKLFTTETQLKHAFGFIDKTGKVVIEPRFSEAKHFYQGVAQITFDGNSWGYVNQAGKIVLAPQFDRIVDFTEGPAHIEKKGKVGFFVKTTYQLVDPVFDEVGRFAEGRALIKLNKKWGYIDATGKIVVSPQFEDAADFSNGLAAVRMGKLWGYLAPTGKMAVPPKFINAGDFSEGLAPVSLAGQCGYIDASGKFLLKLTPTPSRFGSFSNGLARIEIPFPNSKGEEDGLQGFIDRRGKRVVEPKYHSTGDWVNGLCVVRTTALLTDSTCGVIDFAGKFILPPKYKDIDILPSGIIQATLSREPEMICLANSAGALIWEPTPFDDWHVTVDKKYRVEFLTPHPPLWKDRLAALQKDADTSKDGERYFSFDNRTKITYDLRIEPGFKGNPETVLTKSLYGIVYATQGTVTSHKSLMSGGYPAKEAELTFNDKAGKATLLRLRLVLADETLFVLLVFGRKEEISLQLFGNSADFYFQSIQLLGKK
ncbi:MAG: WG repeat-containing protein [Blastocatellia bacterium]|nr:WG repeat-containing protein [Blastocatellia bacterium]